MQINVSNIDSLQKLARESPLREGWEDVKKKEKVKMVKIKIPKDEELWVRHCDAAGNLMFVTTSNHYRDTHTLYAVQTDGSLKKLGSGPNPLDLETKFSVKEKVKEGAKK